MSKREPELDLLMRGDLLALTPLAYDDLRTRMLDALRAALPAYTLRDAGDPGRDIVEALATCLDVMGFYHDRILTESKLGSAQLLASVAQLAAVVGYVPAPPIAAVARQFFQAAAVGVVDAATRVAGMGGTPPGLVVFETTVAIPISPAFNSMKLSPLVTRYAGAVRVVVQLLGDDKTLAVATQFFPATAQRQAGPPPALDPLDVFRAGRAGKKGATPASPAPVVPSPGPSLPIDDFRPGMLAIIDSQNGLELCPIAAARRGGVAFANPLLRSYDPQTTVLARTTRIRHLRFRQPLADGTAAQDPALVVFEVSDRPILHLPKTDTPEILLSTLEVFVFDAPGDVPAPDAWDPKTAWKEVPDFSASEAADHHYRTFVDDRLTTHIILRRKLGYRTLLDDQALSRVYVRYAPAIGRTIDDLSPDQKDALLDLDPVTMQLDQDFLTTAMVRPAVKNKTVDNAADWAVLKSPAGFQPGDQIAVLGGSLGGVKFRKLDLVRAEGRYLRWDTSDMAAKAGIMAATATVAGGATYSSSSWIAGAAAALLATPRTIRFTSNGTTPAHVPVSLTVVGTDAAGKALTETVIPSTTSGGTADTVNAYATLTSWAYTSAGGTDATLAVGYEDIHFTITQPVDAHDPIADVYDAATGAIAPLADVARGQLYPLWEAFYKQAQPPAGWKPGPVKGSEISLPPGSPATGSFLNSIPSAGMLFLALKPTDVLNPITITFSNQLNFQAPSGTTPGGYTVADVEITYGSTVESYPGVSLDTTKSSYIVTKLSQSSLVRVVPLTSGGSLGYLPPLSTTSTPVAGPASIMLSYLPATTPSATSLPPTFPSVTFPNTNLTFTAKTAPLLADVTITFSGQTNPDATTGGYDNATLKITSGTTMESYTLSTTADITAALQGSNLVTVTVGPGTKPAFPPVTPPPTIPPGGSVPPQSQTLLATKTLVVSVTQQLYLPTGSTFLLLHDSSHVKSGDYLLVGRRLTAEFRQTLDPTTDTGFDPLAPWITAEVVQALEVQGNLVRIKDPITQDFYEDRAPNGEALTEVIVVPDVTSVYYGDTFAQKVYFPPADEDRTFITPGTRVQSLYTRVKIDPLDPFKIRDHLPNWSTYFSGQAWSAEFGELFLAVAGQVQATAPATWSFDITFPSRNLLAKSVASLEIPPAPDTPLPGAPPTIADPVGGQFHVSLGWDQAKAVHDAADVIDVFVTPDLQWTTKDLPDPTSPPLAAGHFRVLYEAGLYFAPDHSPPLDKVLLGGGGTLLIRKSAASPGGPGPLSTFPFTFDNIPPADLQLTGSGAVPSGKIDAFAVSTSATVDVNTVAWTVDWQLPTHFSNPWDHNVTSGMMALDTSTSSALLPFKYDPADDVFVLPTVELVPGSPPDPLRGVTKIWAMPSTQTLLQPTDILGIWRFGVQQGFLDTLPNGQGWMGYLWVLGPDLLVENAMAWNTSGNFSVLAAIVGNPQSLAGATDIRPIHNQVLPLVPLDTSTGKITVDGVWGDADANAVIGLIFVDILVWPSAGFLPFPTASAPFFRASAKRQGSQGSLVLTPPPAGPAFPTTPSSAYLVFAAPPSVSPTGTTGLRLSSGALPVSTPTDALRSVGFLLGAAWQAHPLVPPPAFNFIPIVGRSAAEVAEVEDTPANVFGGFPASSLALRFAYDVALTHANEVCTGRALYATVNPIAGVDSGTNAAVLHNPNDFGTTPTFLTNPTPPPSGAGPTTWTLDSSLDLSAAFNPSSGAAHFTLLSFAQSWTQLDAKTVSLGPLTLELGPTPDGQTLSLEPNDQLVLIYNTPPSTVPAPITAAPQTGTYELGQQSPPDAVRLQSLQVKVDGFVAHVTFLQPQQLQPPWLLTFTAPGVLGPKIADTLLYYSDTTTPQPDTNGMLTFTFDPTILDKILTTTTQQQLYFYTNQKGQLREDLYELSFPSSIDVDQDNLLQSESHAVTGLLANIDSPIFPPNASQPAPRVLICSTQALPHSKDLPDLETVTHDRTQQVFKIPVLSASIVFNSGNFIPVIGTLQARDDKIIRNSLRIWINIAGKTKPTLVTYNPNLSKIVEDIESDPSFKPQYPRDSPVYSFNKAPGGAFTLNFLVIGDDLDPNKRYATVYVEYSADRIPDENLPDPHGYIYKFETPLDSLDPTTEIVVLDPGTLKTDDYLFLHTAQDYTSQGKAGAPPPPPLDIQWTRIQSVAGPVITVSPPFTVAPLVVPTTPPKAAAPNFRRFTLTGYTKPPKPAALDKDYYAPLTTAVIDPPDPNKPNAIPLTLHLGDQLRLDPVADMPLLAALVPGDILLVWHEDSRTAWYHHRTGQEAQYSSDPSWAEWPDEQHEAVVKQVDAEIGVVVLEEPLPARFAVHWDFTPDPAPAIGSGTLALTPPTLRVLPHYRAPFQGTYSLAVLGSGDKTRRFARYTGTLEPNPGLATVPLAAPGVYASNVEVLAVDPRSGAWSRWLQFANIDQATPKDPAFVLGVDASSVGSATSVPFSVSFGDGKTGQLLPTGTGNVYARTITLEPWTTHVAERRLVRIFSTPPNAPQHDAPLPFPVPPEAAAAPKNLRLVIDSGAPKQWSPAGVGQWQPKLEIDVTVGGTTTTWREISREEARLGYHGFYVQAFRPGTVEVFFFSRAPLFDHDPSPTEVSAWEAPESRLWALDAAFYSALEAQDLSRFAGATRLQLLETDGIGPGSLLAFSPSDTGPSETATVSLVDRDMWSATLQAPGLSGTYPLSSSFLRGNLVDIVQGDRQESTLGSGDGATHDLRLAVFNRAPLLHRVTPDSTDPDPAVTVLVDGRPWRRVADLDSAGPRDRVFRLDVETDGSAFVTFGDGTHGAVPPAGNNNITCVIHTGDGAAGNLPAGAINKLRDGNLAVQATWNVIDAAGGTPAETADQARETLLGRDVLDEGVITPDDAVQVALEVGEVAHARIDPVASATGTLTLVVALEGRGTPPQSTLDTIQQRIAARMPSTAGVALQVVAAQQVAVHMVVEYGVSAGYTESDVLAALVAAFGAGAGAFFAAERWPVGEALRLGDVYEALYAVPGVASAQVLWMSLDREPDTLAGGAPDFVSPGADGVIQCDTDTPNDPAFARGNIRFTPLTSGGAS